MLSPEQGLSKCILATEKDEWRSHVSSIREACVKEETAEHQDGARRQVALRGALGFPWPRIKAARIQVKRLEIRGAVCL